MGITSNDLQRAKQIEMAVDEFFKENNVDLVQAKGLMDLFIEKGIFNNNHRDGLPIRKFLRHLDDNKSLHLIPQVHFEQKKVNKNWFFINTNK